MRQLRRSKTRPTGKTATIEALANGTIIINEEITGGGSLRAIGGIVNVNNANVEMAHVEIEQAGKLLVDGNATVIVTRSMTLSGGGVYEAKDLNDSVTASLRAGNIVVRAEECGPTATSLHVSQSMSLLTDGNLEISGLGGFGRTTSGGCDPPGYKATGASRVEVGGDFVLRDFAAATHTSTSPLLLHGSFDIQRSPSQFFAWEFGAIRLAGGSGADTTLHIFEVAGVDLGPSIEGFDENFAIDTIEVAAGSTVEFRNAAPSAVSSEPCSEALYVHTLRLEAGSEVSLNDCRVYYLFLDNAGVSPAFSGDGQCAALVQIPSGDVNGDRSIDLLDLQELIGCSTGPVQGTLGDGCVTFDFDSDQDVDILDVSAFQRRFMTEIR